jgi:hypothetical protein
MIAQGPGFYGVNIRLISNDKAQEVVERALELKWELVSVQATTPEEINGTLVNIGAPDGTTVIITPPVKGPSSASNGFDTGWWDQGEAAITLLYGGNK